MSRHYFDCEHQSGRLRVILGYDCPLDEYFMQIEQCTAQGDPTHAFPYASNADPDNRSVEAFWIEAKQLVADIFPDATACSAGRCGGWMVLEGLPDLDIWDAILVAKFAKLSRLVKADISFRSSHEAILDDIAANRWAETGAEYFNSLETRAREVRCAVGEKQKTIAAGFAAVVRA